MCVGQCLVHKDKTQLYESTAASESESSDQVRDIPSVGVVTTIRPKGTLPYFCSSVSYHYPLRDCQGVLSLLLFYAIEYMRHIGNSLVNRTCLWSVLGNVCVVSLTLLVRGEIWLVSS